MSDCTNGQQCDCDPTFTISAPNPPPPPVVWWNARQCATASCSGGLDGAPVTKCIEANTVSSTVSQSDANAQAYALALQQATNALNCGLAGQLNSLNWRIPIIAPLGPNSGSCVDPADQTAVAQGSVGQLYSVHLRIRGLVELKDYGSLGVGGVADAFKFTCANPANAFPSVPANPQNEYALLISDPPSMYFLNNGHFTSICSAMDFKMTVSIRTGATITLKATAIDNAELANSGGIVVNNAPPPISVTEPYNGQFIEMVVEGVF